MGLRGVFKLLLGGAIVSLKTTFPIKRIIPFGIILLIFMEEGTRTIKCNADERCRRRLDGAEPLSAPAGSRCKRVLLRCPTSGFGDKAPCHLPTAATRSARSSRHRRRSHRSPFRCTPSCGRQQSLSQPVRLTAPFTQGSLYAVQQGP